MARVNRDRSSSSSASGIGGDLRWVIGRKEGAKRRMIIKEIKRAIVGINGVEVENIVNVFYDNIGFFDNIRVYDNIIEGSKIWVFNKTRV